MALSFNREMLKNIGLSSRVQVQLVFVLLMAICMPMLHGSGTAGLHALASPLADASGDAHSVTVSTETASDEQAHDSDALHDHETDEEEGIPEEEDASAHSEELEATGEEDGEDLGHGCHACWCLPQCRHSQCAIPAGCTASLCWGHCKWPNSSSRGSPLGNCRLGSCSRLNPAADSVWGQLEAEEDSGVTLVASV